RRAPRRPSLLLLLERRRVDAVAQPRRIRSVGKHVTEMAAALLAVHFGPRHEVALVALRLDGVGIEWLVEARPAGTGIEFRVPIEQRCATSGAHIHRFIVRVPIRPGEGALRPLLAEHVVLLRRELFAPLVVGFLGHVTRRYAGCTPAVTPEPRRL